MLFNPKKHFYFNGNIHQLRQLNNLSQDLEVLIIDHINFYNDFDECDKLEKIIKQYFCNLPSSITQIYIINNSSDINFTDQEENFEDAFLNYAKIPSECEVICDVFRIFSPHNDNVYVFYLNENKYNACYCGENYKLFILS